MEAVAILVRASIFPSFSLLAHSSLHDPPVTVLYDYAAQGSDELSLVAGERLELTVLGRQYGDGWWEGIKGGQVGIFPSNYTG